MQLTVRMNMSIFVSKFSSAMLSLGFPAAAGGIIFASAGRWNLPMVWAVIGVLAGFSLAVVAFTDPGLVRERRHPGPGNKDRLTRPLGVGILLSHWILVGLDVGRFQWSPVPFGAQVAGLVGYAASVAFLLWAMRVNPFYSSVVRVQHERGHRPIVSGPYRYVRHPGYAASIVALLCGGMALGSWLAILPLLAGIALFVRRTLVEDRLLQQELEGYAEYAQKVRHRLIAGIF
jgi:protein-S-isoprenylcysteine O-methyltransferase Ste14